MDSLISNQFPLLKAVQEQVQEQINFDSIKFEVSNSKHSSVYNISFSGFFILVSQNQIFCFNIFLPNFLPFIDTSQLKSVFFLLNSNQKIQYKFIFSTKDEAKKFYDVTLTVLEKFQPLIKNVNLNFCSIKEELIVLIPNSKQVINADVFIGVEKGNSCNHAVLNVTPILDSSKKSKKTKKSDKSKKKEKDFTLELNFSSKINVTQPTDIPIVFGENTFRKITTEVYQNENEKCLILCKNVEESLNMILSIFFLSYSRQNLNSNDFAATAKLSSVFLVPLKRPVVSFKSVDQEMKVKMPVIPVSTMEKKKSMPNIEIQSVNPPRHTRPNRSDTIIIPDDVSASPKQNENENSKNNQESKKNDKNDNDDDFIIEFEEIAIENAHENKKMKNLIEFERATKSRANTLSRKNVPKRYRSGSSVVRRGDITPDVLNYSMPNVRPQNDEDNEIDYSFFTSNVITNSEFNENCEKSIEAVNQTIHYLEEERRKARKNRSVEDSLPDFETYINQLNPPKSEMMIQGDTSLNVQLEKSFEFLNANSYDDQFITIKETNEELTKTDEIVKRSINFFSDLPIQSASETKNDNDFFEFFDFKNFPSYNQNEFKLSSEPRLGFIDKLVICIESIEIKKIKKLYSDTEGQSREQVGQNLTALIASIFINGVRGFERVNDISSRDYEICNNIINSLRAVSGTIPELLGICQQLSKMIKSDDNSNSACDIATLVSALAVLMLNNGIIIEFLRTIQKSDEWISRFYFPTSIMASSQLINNTIILLNPLFCNIQFLLSIESSSTCLFNQPANFIDTIVKAPAQGFLEVDPYILLSMGPISQQAPTRAFPTPSGNILSLNSISSSPSKPQVIATPKDIHDIDTKSSFLHAIIHQFSFGLKPGFIKISDSQRQFSFINDVSTSSSISNISEKNKNAWKEFTETTKFLKNANGMVFKEMSYVIEEWVSIGLEKKLLHMWLLFLGVHSDIVSKYYYSNSTFADPYRLKFVVKAIIKFYKSME